MLPTKLSYIKWSITYNIGDIYNIQEMSILFTPSAVSWSLWYMLGNSLHSVELFLVLDGAKEIKGGAELRGVGEKAAQTPVAQVLSPHLRRSPASQRGGFPWLCWGCAGCCVFLAFPPSGGLSHWEDEEVDQTKETERKSSNKPGVVNGRPGEAARLWGARTLPNTRYPRVLTQFILCLNNQLDHPVFVVFIHM